MIVQARITTYLHSLDAGNGEFLDMLRIKAEAEHVPVIRQETEQLVKVLLKIKKPRHILEVGTAVGYSALVMAASTPANVHITTIEKYEKRIEQAYENFRLSEFADRITLLEGDAADLLRELAPFYDFIFMDAAKGQYLNFLPEVMRLLPEGGVLLSDNVLQDGDLIESRYLVTRRNRTIHARMREYLYTLTHMPELETAVVPVGDGLAVSTRIVTGEEGAEKIDG